MLCDNNVKDLFNLIYTLLKSYHPNVITYTNAFHIKTIKSKDKNENMLMHVVKVYLKAKKAEMGNP